MHNSNLEQVIKEFVAFKEKAGNPDYVACFGKTFVEEGDENYIASKEIGKLVIESGFGVLHGGYIGTMQAVSRGANDGIKLDPKKNEFWNIGVPMKTFDSNVKRADCSQLTATENILDRKRVLIEMCEACIALPVAGFGTLLEVIEIFHVNQINSKFGGKIRPIIFYGKIWKNLMGEIMSKLDLKGQSDGEDFCTYIDDLSKLKETLQKMKS
jgi:predicted Rossmann-fold nucleotide-binding protein